MLESDLGALHDSAQHRLCSTIAAAKYRGAIGRYVDDARDAAQSPSFLPHALPYCAHAEVIQ